MKVLELATDAAEEAVTTHTIGIIGSTEAGPRTSIGTGSAVEWRGRRMILTAAHVLKPADPSQLRFLFRPEGTIQREFVESRAPQARFFRAQEIEIRGIRFFDPLDLALIDVSPELDKNHPVTFQELDPASTTPAVGSIMMVIGFPSALRQRVHAGHFAASRAIAYEHLCDPGILSDIDVDTEFAMTYSYGEEVEPEGIHPHGFSGAGIWSYHEADSPVWRAGHALGGILTTYFPRKKLMTGLRVETITAALDEI